MACIALPDDSDLPDDDPRSTGSQPSLCSHPQCHIPHSDGFYHDLAASLHPDFFTRATLYIKTHYKGGRAFDYMLIPMGPDQDIPIRSSGSIVPKGYVGKKDTSAALRPDPSPTSLQYLPPTNPLLIAPTTPEDIAAHNAKAQAIFKQANTTRHEHQPPIDDNVQQWLNQLGAQLRAQRDGTTPPPLTPRPLAPPTSHQTPSTPGVQGTPGTQGPSNTPGISGAATNPPANPNQPPQGATPAPYDGPTWEDILSGRVDLTQFEEHIPNGVLSQAIPKRPSLAIPNTVPWDSWQRTYPFLQYAKVPAGLLIVEDASIATSLGTILTATRIANAALVHLGVPSTNTSMPHIGNILASIHDAVGETTPFQPAPRIFASRPYIAQYWAAPVRDQLWMTRQDRTDALAWLVEQFDWVILVAPTLPDCSPPPQCVVKYIKGQAPDSMLEPAIPGTQHVAYEAKVKLTATFAIANAILASMTVPELASDLVNAM